MFGYFYGALGYHEGDPLPGDVAVDKRPSDNHQWLDGEWVLNLSHAKTSRLAELNSIAQSLADSAIASYPKAETLSWPDQASEALAWAANNAAPTPYLDAFASIRGLDRVEYLDRTVAKIGSFKSFSAFVFGTRQGYADQIDAAADEAELNAIVFDFS